jgi:hypothetical protein
LSSARRTPSPARRSSPASTSRASPASADSVTSRHSEEADDPIGDEPDVVVVAHDGAEHGELVAPEAGDGVAAPRQAHQPSRHLDEDVVAGLVPERVVDRLEVVEVDEDHRHPCRPALERGDQLSEPVEHARAVGEAGEVVVQGEVGELGLGGDVA